MKRKWNMELKLGLYRGIYKGFNGGFSEYVAFFELEKRMGCLL